MAQAIFFAFGLLLPIFYNPEQFGAFAVLMTTINIFAIVGTLRTEVILMLPSKEEEAHQLFLLGLRFLWIAGLIFFLVAPALYYGGVVVDFSSGFLYVFIACFFGFFSLFRAYLVKRDRLRQYARWSVFFALLVSLSQLAFYWFGIEGGLIYGYLTGLAFILFWMVFYVHRQFGFQLNKEWANELFKRYFSIVKYSYPSGVLNVIALNILPVIITGIFSLKIAGIYFLANTLLNKPISVLTGSIGQNYYKTAATLETKSNLWRLTRHTLLTTGLLVMLILSVVLSTVNYVLIPWYGAQWELIITYMLWLLPLILAKALFNPISSLAEILDKAQIELFFSIAMILIIALAAYWGNRSGAILVFIKLYATLGALAYLFLLLFFTNLVNTKK